MAGRACPWCESTDTERMGDAGSLLMTQPWYCRGCSSTFEVIRKRVAQDRDPRAVRDARPEAAEGSTEAG